MTANPPEPQNRRYPEPGRERWQPLRCGLLNIFRYDDQEFPFTDGHLLLRGSNGSGKSRVLALTLPFLFEGELSPHRMEPDRDINKRVEWNLLMGKHAERTGYTWLELGRLDGDEPRYLTIGCGMTAVKGRGRLDRWFFITRLRPGRDFVLKTQTGQVFGPKHLIEELGSEAEIFDRARNYRRAVNNRLFQLNDQRYNALLNLLIELRQPQLSRKFHEDHLSNALSEALPPLPDQVIADVADAFRGLDKERDELERLELAAKGTAKFLDTYLRYTRVAARRRAEKVRTTHSSYEDAQRRLKATREEEARAEAGKRENETRLVNLELEDQQNRTRIDTLNDSPEMRKARDLDRASAQAEDCRKREADARNNLERAESFTQDKALRCEQAEQQASATRDETRDAAEVCRQAAESAGLNEQHQRSVTRLGLPDPADRDTIESVTRALAKNVADRRRDLDHLTGLNRRLALTEAELNRAKNLYTELCAQLDDAREAQSQAGKERDLAGRLLLEQLAEWLTNLVELPRDAFDETLDEDLADWCSEGEGQSPLETAVRTARDKVTEQLSTKRAGLNAERVQTEEELERLTVLHEQLRTGYHEPPPAPHTRDALAREEIPGAPLWQLCDFREGTDEDTRAGLEAALEASGLLDAWVLPDGRLLAPEIQDTALALLDQPHDGPNLAALLQAAVDLENPRAAAVDPELVNQLLAGIGAGTDQGSVWVDADGSWRVGPLHGHWNKERAEHIGQGAREAYRRKRLKEVEAAMSACREHLERLEEAFDLLEQRRRHADAEVGSMPDHAPIRRAFANLAAAREQVNRLMERVAHSESEVARCRTAETEARKQRDDDAHALGLTDWVDKTAELTALTNAYDRELAALRPTLEKHLNNLTAYQRTRADLAEAQMEEERRKQEFQDRLTERVEAESRFETLQATHGKTVEEVRRQLSLARTRADEIRDQIKQANIAVGDNKAVLARLEEKARQLQVEQARADKERAEAIGDLERFAQARLLAVAVRGLVDKPEETWSVSRAVQIARDIENRLQEVNADEKAWRRLDSKIHQTINELIDELRPRGYEPFQDKVDGVMVVMVPLQGSEHTMTELNDILQEQIADRRELMSARERAVLEKHLIGEVTQVMHELLHECEYLVKDMNKELASRPTSSGLTLKFEWKTTREADAALVQARRLLMRAGGTWSPQERDTLGRFLQLRIQEARNAIEAGNWYDHLKDALDYRKWHAFQFKISDGKDWRSLNRKSHGEKSGGEKVTALMLLQLAAAAAHYRSADNKAPRLILLDEAFVGVDDKMRAQCMGLLGSFDLDFMMTSEREKGCYETLPGVSICQLSGYPGIDAVYVSHLTWNGRQAVSGF
ncbi:MAG: TIGR02680 family protein [Acidobacteriota bacterium]|nr:TIGR02680 family protein [Acidobacteriota bacterium]